jgi:hypothetical protein
LHERLRESALAQLALERAVLRERRCLDDEI